MRALILVLGLTLPLAGGCGSNDKCPAANPGMCPPSPFCVDGFRQSGASCENGEWVCARVACTPDAGLDSGTD
jgi:hypothetical protein